MATTPQAILEAAMAAGGVTVAPDAPPAGGPIVGAAGAPAAVPPPPPPLTTVPAPVAGSEPSAIPPGTDLSHLTPDQLAALAAGNAEPAVAPPLQSTVQPPVPGAPTAPAPDPVLQRLIASGIAPEAAQTLAAQINGTANLHKRLDDLLPQVQQLVQRATPPEPETPFDASADPDVKFYSDQVASIDADLQVARQQTSSAIQVANRVNTRIAALQGERVAWAKAGNTEELARVDGEIAAQQRQYDDAKADYRLGETEAKRLEREKTDKAFQRDRAISIAKTNHQQSVQQTSSDRVESAVAAQQTNAQFNAALAKHAGAYGIAATPKLRADLVNRFQLYIQAMPPEQRSVVSVDLDQFVGVELDSMAREWGLSRKADFTQHSRDVAAAALRTVPTPAQPSGAVAAPTVFDNLTPEQKVQAVRLNARRVLQPGS